MYRLFLRTIILIVLGSVLIFWVTASGQNFHSWLWVILASTVLGSLVSILNYRDFHTPLRNLVTHVDRLKQGDFSARFDEDSAAKLLPLAKSLNEMSNNVEKLLQQVSKTAKQVAVSAEQLGISLEQSNQVSDQVTALLQDTMEGAQIQTKNVEKSTQAMNEMSAGVQQAAVNAQNASNSTMQATEIAHEGKQAVHTVIQQMNSVNSMVANLEGIVRGLGEQSGEIGKIIEVITGISEQTNLLALNAAIEAARAGEHGRGFAVVADEVRKLAEQSAQSAKQITELIAVIQTETSKAVESMDASSREFSSGMNAVKVAAESFAHITSAVDDVTTQVQEISAATEQMAAGAEEIFKITDFTSKVQAGGTAKIVSASAAAQQQSASIKETAATASILKRAAAELQAVLTHVGK